MPPKSSDPLAKATAAGNQLQAALMSASEALKTIAAIVPSLFPASSEVRIAPKPSTSTNTISAGLQGDSADAQTSNKRKRKEKDPEAPEKPPSAYHLYLKEHRDRIKASLPGTPSASEVVQEVSLVWKGLSDELKKVSTSMTKLTIAFYRRC
jgi:HMG (high mobility group) box